MGGMHRTEEALDMETDQTTLWCRWGLKVLISLKQAIASDLAK